MSEDFQDLWQFLLHHGEKEILTIPEYTVHDPAHDHDLENRLHQLYERAYRKDLFQTLKGVQFRKLGLNGLQRKVQASGLYYIDSDSDQENGNDRGSNHGKEMNQYMPHGFFYGRECQC